MVVLPRTSQPGLRVDLSLPISRLRDGRNIDASIRWETSSLGVTNTAQPGWEGSSRGHRHR